MMSTFNQFLSIIGVLFISIIWFRIRLKNKKESKALLFFIQVMLFILANHFRFFFLDHVIAALFGLTHTLGSGFIFFVSGANEHANSGGISDGTSRPPALEYSSGTGARESTSRSSASWNDLLEEAQLNLRQMFCKAFVLKTRT